MNEREINRLRGAIVKHRAHMDRVAMKTIQRMAAQALHDQSEAAIARITQKPKRFRFLDNVDGF